MSISLNSDGMNLSALWNAGLSFGADPSFDTPRTPVTVSTSGIEQMEPITGANDGGGLSQFWQDITKTFVGYAIAKDAARNNVPAPQQYVPTGQGAAMTGGQPQQYVQRSDGGLVMVLVLGGLAYMVLRD